MFRIICIFALGIVGSSYPMTREKLIPPFPFNKDKVLERISEMVKKSTKSEFVVKLRKKHGDVFDTSNVVYINATTKVTITCKKCGLEFEATPNSMLNGTGCPHCGRTSLICGVGINDVPIATRHGSIKDVSYKKWKSMLERCYSEKYHQKEPSYLKCEVCDEWKRFSNFKKWFDENYIEGYHLDKDILGNGSKVYSPETCCFVPQEINKALQVSRINKNNGITKYKNGFSVYVPKYGKNIYLGNFKAKEEARLRYRESKIRYIKELANKYFKNGEITEKVFNALNNICVLWMS